MTRRLLLTHVVVASCLALTVCPAPAASLKGKPIRVFPDTGTSALFGATVTAVEGGGFMATWGRNIDADIYPDALYYRYFKANGKPSGAVKRYDRAIKGLQTRSAYASLPVALGDGRQFAPWTATFEPSTSQPPRLVGQFFKASAVIGKPKTIADGSDASSLISTPLRGGGGLFTWYSAARNTIVGRLIDDKGKLGRPDLEFDQQFSAPIPLSVGFARIRTTNDTSGVNALCQIFGASGAAATSPFLLYSASSTSFGNVTVLGLSTRRIIAFEATNNQNGMMDVFAHQFDLGGRRIGQVAPLVKNVPIQEPLSVETPDGGFVLALKEAGGADVRYRSFDDRLKLVGQTVEKRTGVHISLPLRLLTNGLVAASYRTSSAAFFVQLVRP